MLNVLVSGKVVKQPKTGTSAKGTAWTSVSIRCPIQAQKEDEAPDILANVIGFGDAAERLGRLGVGDSVAVNGDARLNHWTGQDGAQKTGLSVTVFEVLTAYSMKKKRGEPGQSQQNSSGVSKNSTWGIAGKANESRSEEGFDDALGF